MRAEPVSARRAVREAAGRLEAAGVPEPAASAEVLLSELLGIRRGEIALRDRPLDSEEFAVYEEWISRRIEREPVQRILGYAYFRNLKLELNEDTLIPRPDTESVVDVAIECIDRRGGLVHVLDIGTGSGAIAISIAQERPRCEVHATDISGAAIEIARRNARLNGARVRFHRVDVAAGLEFLQERVDLLVSNPPYVGSNEKERLAPEVRAWDPPVALYSGPDPFAFYRRIFAEAPLLLSRAADVVLEVGDAQAETVIELGETAGFVPTGSHRDLAGSLRAVTFRWEGR